MNYTSELYIGNEARSFLKRLWPDYKVANADVALFEKVSGYAGTQQVIKGLTQHCLEEGVRLFSGVEVVDYNIQAGQISSLSTNRGEIKCDLVIWGLGAWTPEHWKKVGKPMTLDVVYSDQSLIKDKEMWTYWRLREGEIYHDKPYVTPDGLNPPILHVELMNTPVYDDQTGDMLEDFTYVYYKNGNERMDRAGLQGRKQSKQ